MGYKTVVPRGRVDHFPVTLALSAFVYQEPFYTTNGPWESKMFSLGYMMIRFKPINAVDGVGVFTNFGFGGCWLARLVDFLRVVIGGLGML